MHFASFVGKMSDARYPGISAERQKALMDSFLKGSQPIADLLAGKGALKGADAQTLRNHFSSYGLHPAGSSAALESVRAILTEFGQIARISLSRLRS